MKKNKISISTKGVTRIVFIFNSFVIKIPKFTNHNNTWSFFLRGIIANISEHQTWKWNSGKYESGQSHLLCPVIWCSWGGWILIMKRAKVFTWDEWDAMEYSNDEHMKYFKGDDTISNYGVFENRLVKIDYADLNNFWGEDFKALRNWD